MLAFLRPEAIFRIAEIGGYAIIVDGCVKTEFATKDGVESGARDLKRRFPTLQVKIYDAQAKLRREINTY